MRSPAVSRHTCHSLTYRNLPGLAAPVRTCHARPNLTAPVPVSPLHIPLLYATPFRAAPAMPCCAPSCLAKARLPVFLPNCARPRQPLPCLACGLNLCGDGVERVRDRRLQGLKPCHNRVVFQIHHLRI